MDFKIKPSKEVIDILNCRKVNETPSFSYHGLSGTNAKQLTVLYSPLLGSLKPEHRAVAFSKVPAG